MNQQVETELKSLLNSRYSTSESARGNYARGEDTYDPILSKAVVFPETNEEVSKILKLFKKLNLVFLIKRYLLLSLYTFSK